MSQVDYPRQVKELILHLKKLPGIGPRGAERIAIWLLQQDGGVAQSFAATVEKARGEVWECGVCGFFSTEQGCPICDGSGRDETVLCVVEQPTDILPLERSGAFRGHYHALRGKISPLDNVGPDDLRIGELMDRLKKGAFEEVILALGADVEGEATSNYLVEVLENEGLKITRLAMGIPVGGGLESADELTLFRAVQGRTALGRGGS